MRQEREIASFWGRPCITFLVKSEYDYGACVLLFRLETVSAPSCKDCRGHRDLSSVAHSLL